MIERFHVRCDLCGVAGPEYGPTVVCEECGRDLNPCCAAVWQEEEPPFRAVCRDCILPATAKEWDAMHAPRPGFTPTGD